MDVKKPLAIGRGLPLVEVCSAPAHIVRLSWGQSQRIIAAGGCFQWEWLRVARHRYDPVRIRHRPPSRQRRLFGDFGWIFRFRRFWPSASGLGMARKPCPILPSAAQFARQWVDSHAGVKIALRGYSAFFCFGWGLGLKFDKAAMAFVAVSRARNRRWVHSNFFSSQRFNPSSSALPCH